MHRRDKCPHGGKAVCNKCNIRGHFGRACARRGTGQKRQRSTTPTRVEEETDRHSSRNRTSTFRTTPSPRSTEDSDGINITTKRVGYKLSRQMPKWEGLTPESLYKAGRLEHKIRKAGSMERQSLKKLHCNVFKGRRPPVPSIP